LNFKIEVILMQKTTKSLAYTAGWVSIIVNIVLFSLKYWVGIISDSVAIRADAWHTLSDCLTSIVLIAGFWIASRPADSKHPFGHGRTEAIGAIMIGTFLVVVSFNFLKESINRLQSHEAAYFGGFAIVIFLVSVIVKEGLAQFAIRIGRKIDSQMLVADGWHHRSDAIASGLIVIGILVGSYLWWIDGVMGIAVSLFILYTAYDILKGVASSLLGEELDPVLENRIKKLVRKVAPAASQVHHLHIHRYGDHIELTLHIMLPSNVSLKEAHDIAEAIEEALRKKMKIEATVHMDPSNN
jgi:cation diffusion facilitator family transporter